MTPVFSVTVIEILLSVVIVTVAAILTYYQWAFTYWQKRGVPNIVKPKFPFGTLRNLVPNKIHFGYRYKCLYNQIKSRGLKHGGAFKCTTPVYVVIDPNYIKNILQKDFHHFVDRGFYYNEKIDPLSGNLFAIGGEKWRCLRTKLSPAFTAAKLKTMFANLVRCSNEMRDVLDNFCEKKQTINIREVAECFTINVIGSCAFGIECNCFKNPDTEFRKEGNKFFSFPLTRLVKIIIAFSYPKFAGWLGIKLFDKETTDFFVNVVKEAIQFRETNNIRKDVLQLLRELKVEWGDEIFEENKNKSRHLTIEEITAQVFLFFAAGFRTSSLTLIYSLFELAQNRDMQEKLRGEINYVLSKKNGKITYEALNDMKYMNQVVEEILRKYPPASFLTRVCAKDYTMPDTEIVIEKGIEAHIPILGLHHDPDYYPNPEKFEPDRFSEENKEKRHPFAYIPFGEGPRMCIGFRFGLMQVKVGLIVFLKKYRYSLNKKTELPIQMEPSNFTLLPRSDIYLDMEKVS